MTLTELSRVLGVSKSTAYAILSTMLARGFVADSGSGMQRRYRLGMALARLGDLVVSQHGLRDLAHAGAARAHRGNRADLARRHPRRDLRRGDRPGRRPPGRRAFCREPRSARAPAQLGRREGDAGAAPGVRGARDRRADRTSRRRRRGRSSIPPRCSRTSPRFAGAATRSTTRRTTRASSASARSWQTVPGSASARSA